MSTVRMINSALLLLLSCLAVITLSACTENDAASDANNTPPIIMHNSSGTIYFSYLQEVPPGEVIDSKPLFSFTAPWGYRTLSISPTGKYGAIAMFSQQGTSREWEGKIILYNTEDGGMFKEYNKASLISLMNFTVADASMFIAQLDWMNESELLVHLQPQAPWIESVPQNASLLINVVADTTVDLKYSNRSAPFAIQAPAHPSKLLYPSETRQNKIYIDGKIVSNLPEVTAYDIYFPED